MTFRLKEGRSGKLVFVKLRHEVRCNDVIEPALVEFHDIVYRAAQGANDVARLCAYAPP